MRFIDLFAGVGGFHIGLANLGHHCVYASEIDEHAARCYNDNFGIKPDGDITEVPADSIPEHDILAAGFPCQSFTQAGHRKGFNDPRGMLFFEIIRIAKYHQPKYMILENVKHILKIDDGAVISEVYVQVKHAGYKLYHHIINAGHHGVPQSRHRVIFIAVRNDIDEVFVKPRPTKCDILFPFMDHSDRSMPYVPESDITFTASTTQKHQLKPIQIGHIKGFPCQGQRIYHCAGHAITQYASGGGFGTQTGLYMTDVGVRRLNPLESRRVMGFPDHHVISEGSEGYKQMGNAVVPAVVTESFRSLEKSGRMF